MVNWCPESQSAVSDLEVEMQEVNGHLWHFKYPLISESGEQLDKYLEVATTRPETCLLYTSPSPRDYAASRMPSSA